MLKFHTYVYDVYGKLEHHSEYFEDLEKFRNGIAVNSEDKEYDKILGTLRLFQACICILLKRYKGFIFEIQTHSILDDNHKDLLLRDIFDSQITDYLNGCWVMEQNEELMTIKNDLYIGFSRFETSLFFNDSFYELRNIILDNPDFKKYLNSKY